MAVGRQTEAAGDRNLGRGAPVGDRIPIAAEGGRRLAHLLAGARRLRVLGLDPSTSGGTPHTAAFASRPSIIFLPDARKTLKSRQASSGPAFFWPASLIAMACLWVSSRAASNC
jgi:hypothetical protein